jgi:hypothetical protein
MIEKHIYDVKHTLLNTELAMRAKRVLKACTAAMLGALAVYIVLLAAAIRFGRPLADSVLRSIIHCTRAVLSR